MTSAHDTAGRSSLAIDLLATDEDGGERLDRWLARQRADLSRSRIQALVKAGAVSTAGRTIGEASERVKPGATYRIELPEPAPAAPMAQAIPLAVAYEDEHLIVIDKPAGLVVHPAPGAADGTLVNALIAHCGDSLSGIGGVRRPGIVHRLDKDTSGLLVVAKSDAAHRGLAEQFASHGADGRLHRAYLALVWGVPDRAAGRIEAELARSVTNRTKIAVVPAGRGRHAVSHYRIEDTFALADGTQGVAMLRVELETGRTHQIRVHLAHIRHPVLGDPTYGAGFKASARRLGEEAQAALLRLGRQALHAAELGFEHPVTGEDLAFSSPLPEAMERLRLALAAGL
ncbi:MAG: RluA family pseudouridine synthase [Hyphomicrobiaceae bacterium]|nr:RluA family pseudouridine synthase [Hyphomicrobiaceae bacterium]